jgi:hypothetical protein
METYQITQTDFLNQNAGSDASVHKEAVRAALEAGKAVSDNILIDYPDLRERYHVQSVATPSVVVVDHTQRQVDSLRKHNDTQNQEMIRVNRLQDAEVARFGKIIDQDLASTYGVDDFTKRQNDEIARLSARQDAEIKRMNDRYTSSSEKVSQDGNDFASRQDAEIARMKARWDTEVGKSNVDANESNQAIDTEMAKHNSEQSGQDLAPQDAIATPLDSYAPGELLQMYLAKSKQAQVNKSGVRINIPKRKDAGVPGIGIPQ